MAVGFRMRGKRPFGASVRVDTQTPPVAPQRPAMASGLGMQQAEPQQERKRSVLPYILAAAEDTLSRQMGYAPQGVARLNEAEAARQEQAAQLAEEQRKRSMGREDYAWKREYDLANPGPSKPANPYRFESNDGDVMEYDPNTGETRKLFDDPTPKMQMVMGPDGRPYFINPTGQGAPPARPVGKLTPITGDAGGNASGGFPGN